MLAAPVQIESCSYFVWRSVPYQPEDKKFSDVKKNSGVLLQLIDTGIFEESRKCSDLYSC